MVEQSFLQTWVSSFNSSSRIEGTRRIARAISRVRRRLENPIRRNRYQLRTSPQTSTLSRGTLEIRTQGATTLKIRALRTIHDANSRRTSLRSPQQIQG